MELARHHTFTRFATYHSRLKRMNESSLMVEWDIHRLGNYFSAT